MEGKNREERECNRERRDGGERGCIVKVGGREVWEGGREGSV